MNTLAFLINRRKTVSVTPAIGASTVAGAIRTLPICTSEGTHTSSGIVCESGLSQDLRTSENRLQGDRNTEKSKTRLDPRPKPVPYACPLFPMLLFRSGLSAGASLFVLPAEAFDASCGVNQLLFAGEERVAIRADFQVDIALMGGSGGKRVPASAHYADFVVCGMDIGFHFSSFSYHRGTRSLSASFPGTSSLREFRRIQQTGVNAEVHEGHEGT